MFENRQTAAMLDTSIPKPADARTFVTRRRLRLSDWDASGRTRLDAVARLLQDAAIDDVEETGLGAPEHLWFLRSAQVDVIAPLLHDREVEIVTWCSGVAAIAAGRRWSVVGDAGGHIEVDSIWIHLDSEQRPTRVGEFGPHTGSARARVASTKLLLPDPPPSASRRPWSLRSTDVDAHGHINNAVHWQAVEDRLARAAFDVTRPYRVFIDYRTPIDLEDRVEIAEAFLGEGHLLGFLVADRVAAVAVVDRQLAASPP